MSNFWSSDTQFPRTKCVVSMGCCCRSYMCSRRENYNLLVISTEEEDPKKTILYHDEREWSNHHKKKEGTKVMKVQWTERVRCSTKRRYMIKELRYRTKEYREQWGNKWACRRIIQHTLLFCNIIKKEHRRKRKWEKKTKRVSLLKNLLLQKTSKYWGKKASRGKRVILGRRWPEIRNSLRKQH
jgi:hypothetical protein